MSGWGYWLAGLLVALLGAMFVLWRHRRYRKALYRRLAEERSRTIGNHAPLVAAPAPSSAQIADFAHQRLGRVAGFLTDDSLANLRADCLANRPFLERSFIPTHKKGGTLSYENIHLHAPALLGFYHSPAIQNWVSTLVGERVVPTADHDQSSCSVLYYVEEGDHINWHFDHNFYQGRHFTVLLSLVNRTESGAVTESRLMRKTQAGEELGVDTSENSLIVFEGARVLHKVTPVKAGDMRIVFSMTYCTDPELSWFKELARRIKDTAFFGIRTLWD